MREILVCVTFREFDDGINAKIQHKFLESVKRQSYRKFRLIVTNYREKLVEKTLAESNLPYEFHQSEKDCRFSWTEVIQNSFQHLEKGQNIILWTQADCIFEPNLFSEIIDNFEPDSGGTSWPHVQFATLEDFGRKHPIDNSYKTRARMPFWLLDPNYWVPDAVYVDGDLLLNPENRKLFLDHEIQNCWQGQIQTLFLAFFAKKLKNLFFRSKISEIINARTEDIASWGLESVERLMEEEARRTFGKATAEEWQLSMETLKRFCEAKGVPRRFTEGPLRKLNQHKKYKVVGRFDQKLTCKAYLGCWTSYHYWKLNAYDQGKVLAEQLLAWYGTNRIFEAISLRLAPASTKAVRFPTDGSWKAKRNPRRHLWTNLNPDFICDAVKCALEAPGEFWYEAFNICDKYAPECIDVKAFLTEEYPDVPVKGDLTDNQSLITPAKAERMLGFKPCEDVR